MNRWYVVHTRPHQEGRAEANLVRQGFRVWLPVMERSRRHARRIETVRGALFPGLSVRRTGYRARGVACDQRHFRGAAAACRRTVPAGAAPKLRRGAAGRGRHRRPQHGGACRFAAGRRGHYCRWPLRRMRGGGPAARAGRAGRGAARRTRRPGSGPASKTGGRRGRLTGAGHVPAPNGT